MFRRHSFNICFPSCTPSHKGPAARATRRHQMRPVAPGLPFRNGALGHLVPVAVTWLNREPKKDLVMLESTVFQWFSVAAFPDGWCWLMLVGIVTSGNCAVQDISMGEAANRIESFAIEPVHRCWVWDVLSHALCEFDVAMENHHV